MNPQRVGGPHSFKIVVIDDDPTGSQTVHGCPLLLTWDPATLAAGLRHPSPLLFLLANTRALAPQSARARVREICRTLKAALAEAVDTGVIRRWVVVSRGDSTLRGHFPLEVEVIAEELGPFDATLLVPAFLEGGRTTVNGTHLLHGRPVAESAFAHDASFGYRNSFLPAWIEEKSSGRIPARSVERISRVDLETGGHALRERLAAGGNHRWLVVDAEHPEHLQALAGAVRDRAGTPCATSRGSPPRLLFQSAAGLLGPLAALAPQPHTPHTLAALRRRGADGSPLPGLVLVGSHVPLADEQLAALLEDPRCTGVELEVVKVQRVLEGPLPDRLLASLEQGWTERLARVLTAGGTPVFFTSRGERLCRHAGERRALGRALAGAMARVAGSLAPRLGYLISKGGITSHSVLADGLGVSVLQLQGQLLPGLSLVLAPVRGTAQASGDELPILTFPGNLGEAGTLSEAWRWMESGTGQVPWDLPAPGERGG